MKKRRLISVMLASFITASAGVMSGCDVNVEENTTGYNNYKNVYIILDQKGKEVLHKGDFYDAVGDSDNKYALNCMNGKHVLTNNKFSVMENQPKEDYYDEICEDCFR